MSKNFLDKVGLGLVWNKAKAMFQAKLTQGRNITIDSNNKIKTNINMYVGSVRTLGYQDSEQDYPQMSFDYRGNIVHLKSASDKETMTISANEAKLDAGAVKAVANQGNVEVSANNQIILDCNKQGYSSGQFLVKNNGYSQIDVTNENINIYFHVEGGGTYPVFQASRNGGENGSVNLYKGDGNYCLGSGNGYLYLYAQNNSTFLYVSDSGENGHMNISLSGSTIMSCTQNSSFCLNPVNGNQLINKYASGSGGYTMLCAYNGMPVVQSNQASATQEIYLARPSGTAVISCTMGPMEGDSQTTENITNINGFDSESPLIKEIARVKGRNTTKTYEFNEDFINALKTALGI